MIKTISYCSLQDPAPEQFTSSNYTITRMTNPPLQSDILLVRCFFFQNHCILKKGYASSVSSSSPPPLPPRLMMTMTMIIKYQIIVQTSGFRSRKQLISIWYYNNVAFLMCIVIVFSCVCSHLLVCI